MADPIVVLEPAPLGGGLVAWTISIDFNDGELRSGFVQIAFSGAFNQVLADGMDVDTDDVAASLDGIGGYDAEVDSYFFGTVWPVAQTITGGAPMAPYFEFAGGTQVPGGDVLVADLAYLVLPEGEDFIYSGVISRAGQNFEVVPEPTAQLLGLASLATIGLLCREGAHPRVGRRDDRSARPDDGGREHPSLREGGQTARRADGMISLS